MSKHPAPHATRPDYAFRAAAALALAIAAALALRPAHADDAPRLDEGGKPCPVQTSPMYGLAPLTFCTPALPPSVYLHPAYPEPRATYAAPSYGHGTTTTRGTVTTSHGTVRFDSTTKH